MPAPEAGAPTLEEFRAAARSWLEASAGDAPPDYGAILPPGLKDEGVAWQRRLHDAGWAGIDWPEAYGGRGLTPEHRAVWAEEAAAAGVPSVLNMVGLVLAANVILAFGTDEQKAAHLRATARGDRVWCQLFSEPGAGSDLASLATRAVRDGETFVISGQKVWCSGGRYSDWGILLARTDPDAPKHRGISFFLFDMSLPGVTVRPLRQMTGEAEFDEVFFDDVRVPADALCGPLHGGWGVAMAALTNERGFIGSSVRSLGRTVDALVAAGADAGVGPVARDRLAGLLSTGRALQALGQRQGPVATTAASLLKLGISELAFDSATTRAALAGASAMLEGDAAHAVLAAPGARLGGGTSQIQRTIIGERLLGLPAEPKG